MTREDFADAVAKANAREDRSNRIFIFILFAGAAGGVILGIIPDYYWWANAIGIPVVFASLTGVVAFALFWVRKNAKRFDLRCPHCRKLFLNIHRPRMLAGTGDCCFCGESVFEYSEAPKIAGSVARDTFSAASAKADGGDRIRSYVYLGTMFAGIIFSTLLFQFGGGIWRNAIAVLLLLFSMIIPPRLLLRQLKENARRNGLQCPHCRKLFLSFQREMVFKGTGNCCHCGQPVLTD